jgi:hypothetical protein
MIERTIVHAIAFGLKVWFIIAFVYPETGFWTVFVIIYCLFNSALIALTNSIQELTTELNQKIASEKLGDLLHNLDDAIKKAKH